MSTKDMTGPMDEMKGGFPFGKGKGGGKRKKHRKGRKSSRY